MGEDTLEDNFMESFRKEEGRRRRSPMVTCEGERESASVGGRIE
jgi:hypothetical protein